VGDAGDVTAILSLEFPSDRRAAARATAGGAALFYGFANFCALGALPDRPSALRINRLKGRPPQQAGSVTSDPARMQLAFDWSRLPRTMEPETLLALMTEFHALGPMGFRGPAASRVPDHLTVTDAGMRTAQHISPGVRCRSNALIREVLDLTGEDLLFITSANTSSHASQRIEAAHCEMDEIRREFGHRRDVVMIGHDDETANRAFYPRHLPGSVSILSFHRDVRENGRPALLLERHGSLGIDDIRAVAARHGFGLAIAPSAHARMPVRRPRTQPQQQLAA
jgi:tRNA A37 threonylcarbamoyladenosine synthetase subunit TsaC/SUA5/YrdC